MDDGLFEGAPVPKAARKRKQQEESDGVVVRLETAFIGLHMAMWKCEPFRRGIPRERRMLKELAAQLGEDEVLALVRQFFSTRNRKGDYTILDFERQIAAIRLERQRQQADPRTVANIDAAARATGRKP